MAILATLVFIFWSVFCILMLEWMHLYRERSDELREQTRLLRRIAKKLDGE